MNRDTLFETYTHSGGRSRSVRKVKRLLFVFLLGSVSVLSPLAYSKEEVLVKPIHGRDECYTIVSYVNGGASSKIPFLKGSNLVRFRKTIEVSTFIREKIGPILTDYMKELMKTPLQEKYALYRNDPSTRDSDAYAKVKNSECLLRKELGQYLTDDPPVLRISVRKKNTILFFVKREENKEGVHAFGGIVRGEIVNFYNLSEYYECYDQEANISENCPQYIATIDLKSQKFSVELPVFSEESYVCSLNVVAKW